MFKVLPLASKIFETSRAESVHADGRSLALAAGEPVDDGVANVPVSPKSYMGIDGEVDIDRQTNMYIIDAYSDLEPSGPRDPNTAEQSAIDPDGSSWGA